MSLLDLLKRKVPLLVLLDATGQAQYDKNLLQFVEPNNFDFDFRQINTYAKESCYLSSSHIQTFFFQHPPIFRPFQVTSAFGREKHLL